MPTDVTCPDCLRRLASGSARDLKARYRIGSHVTLARPLAQGHAMFWLDGKRLISLCLAAPRKETPR
jgi:hypothetical protein